METVQRKAVSFQNKNSYSGEKKKICLTVWDVRNAGTFYQGIFHPYNHIYTLAPVHGLLEYARMFRSEPVLGQ